MRYTFVALLILHTVCYSRSKADSLLNEYFEIIPKQSLLIAGKIDTIGDKIVVLRGVVLSSRSEFEDSVHYIIELPKKRVLYVIDNKKEYEGYVFLIAYEADIIKSQICYKPSDLSWIECYKAKKLLKEYIQELLGCKAKEL